MMTMEVALRRAVDGMLFAVFIFTPFFLQFVSVYMRQVSVETKTRKRGLYLTVSLLALHCGHLRSK